MNIYSEDKMYESYSSEVERMQKCIDELQQENKQIKIQISAREEVCDRLESNWNKLKEWVNKHYDYYMNNEDYIGGTLCFTDIKNKIQEIEQGSDSNE